MWPFENRVTDRVWVDQGILYLKFSQSGSKGGLSAQAFPNQDIGFNCISMTDGDGGKVDLEINGKIIDSFPNREVANQAGNLIVKVLLRQVRRAKLRKFFLFFALPIAIVLILLMITGFFIQEREAQRQASAFNYGAGMNGPQNMDEIMKMFSNPAVTAETLKQFRQGAIAPQVGMPLAQSPAKLLGLPDKIDLDEVKKLNMLVFGPGKTPDFYVFSDPQCSSCRQLEPELAASGKTYAVIPVAIGGAESANTLMQIMCASDPGKEWKNVIAGGKLSAATEDKAKIAVCAQQLLANMNAFKKFGFPGTPTIISKSGKPMLFDGSKAQDLLNQASK